MKNIWMAGNNHSGEMAAVRWLSRAFGHGFADENEMWSYLIKDQSLSALGDLFGVSPATVGRRLKVCGTPNHHGFGGSNHRRVALKQRAIMSRKHEFADYCQRMERLKGG